MLFQVAMTVKLPPGLDPAVADELKAREKAMAQKLQQDGRWRHLWRVAGLYANISIFDVESNQALHELLTALPLYPYLSLDITPLCRHPSSIHDDDR